MGSMSVERDGRQSATTSAQQQEEMYLQATAAAEQVLTSPDFLIKQQRLTARSSVGIFNIN
jgi:hypothetical protein